MSGPVVVLGVFMADATVRADRLPRIGGTILGRSLAPDPGGKGFNQAVAAGRADAAGFLKGVVRGQHSPSRGRGRTTGRGSFG